MAHGAALRLRVIRLVVGTALSTRKKRRGFSGSRGSRARFVGRVRSRDARTTPLPPAGTGGLCPESRKDWLLRTAATGERSDARLRSAGDVAFRDHGVEADTSRCRRGFFAQGGFASKQPLHGQEQHRPTSMRRGKRGDEGSTDRRRCFSSTRPWNDEPASAVFYALGPTRRSAIGLPQFIF